MLDGDKEARVLQKLDRNYRLFHRVDEGQEIHGMGWLKKMIHKLAARDGCNVVIIDPWNVEIEHMLEPGESMANYANFALMRGGNRLAATSLTPRPLRTSRAWAGPCTWLSLIHI